MNPNNENVQSQHDKKEEVTENTSTEDLKVI
jgi:hypothetical protein